MQKILPVEEHVKLNSYTYYSFQQAIIASKYRIGNKAAVIKLSGKNIKWNYISKDLSMKQKDEYFIFESNKFGLNMNAILYRPMQECEVQGLDIQYFKFSSAFGQMGCFLTDEKPTQYNMKKSCEFGAYCRDEFFYINKKGEKICYPRKQSEKFGMIIERNEERCIFYEKTKDGRKEITQHILSEPKKNLYLCVYINLKNDSYYAWQFQNFLQLKYNKESEYIMLEFDMAIKRYWKYFSTNYFIDYTVEDINLIHELKVDLLDYIKVKLEHNNYIEMDVDSIDIYGSMHYKNSNYLHTCLIYGFDDRLQLVFLLSVSGGKLVRGYINYNEFNKQVNRNKSLSSENQGMIISHYYNPDPNGYIFSKDRFIHDLRCYLDGKTVIDTDVLIPIVEYCYGTKVYDEMLSENGIDIFLRDRRISSVLKEHCTIMKDRIEYLYANNYINEEEYKNYYKIASFIYNDSTIIQNKVIFNQVTESKSIEKVKFSVKYYLYRIKISEKLFYQEIIDCLTCGSVAEFSCVESDKFIENVVSMAKKISNK